MARLSEAERLSKLHSEALAEFDEIQNAQREVRLQCLQDRRFYSIAGAQWEGPGGEQFANKPRFEFNKIHLSVIRIFSEYRNNRITVDFQPKDGTKDDKLADTCDGLYRADEQACTADEAYDNGFEEGVGGGFGAWRLRSCYEDELDDENTQQQIRMEPIFDADSTVFFDLGAKRYDKSDAKRCYVLTPYTFKGYEEEFGEDPSTWPKDITQAEFDWCTPDLIWVCELYRVEQKSEMVHFFRGLDEDADDMRVTDREIDADPNLLDELQATGFREVRQKKVTVNRVMKYLMNGNKMLSKGEEIPGGNIPIVPYFGKRWVVDGVERCMGHVRLAKDAQRLENMLMSWLANIAGRFDMEKPIMSPEQILGHADMWAQDNIDNFPYLLANLLEDEQGNPIPGSNAPAGYTRAPNVPPVMAALAQVAGQALTDLLGNQQAGEEMRPNISGKAVELIQQRLDMQVFIYMSNLAKSMKRCGEIWLGMKRETVVEEGRQMKVIDADGNASSVVMNRPMYDSDTAETNTENDITKANFGVWVDVGPSSSSRRSATVRALTGMMQITQDPETQTILSALAMMNMEGEGISDARDFFRKKLVNMGAVKPTEEEAQQIAQAQANQQPDPQSLALIGMAKESEAKAVKANADTVETLASADLKRAQTAETLAKTMGEHQSQQIATFDAMQGILSGHYPGQSSAPAMPPTLQ